MGVFIESQYGGMDVWNYIWGGRIEKKVCISIPDSGFRGDGGGASWLSVNGVFLTNGSYLSGIPGIQLCWWSWIPARGFVGRLTVTLNFLRNPESI